jgi:hypothetical protein
MEIESTAKMTAFDRKIERFVEKHRKFGCTNFEEASDYALRKVDEKLNKLLNKKSLS